MIHSDPQHRAAKKSCLLTRYRPVAMGAFS